MTFLIIFILLYGLGLGLCRLSAMLFTGTDALLVKNIAYVPILNIVAVVIIVLFMFYLVRDYRKNNKQNTETVGSSNG